MRRIAALSVVAWLGCAPSEGAVFVDRTESTSSPMDASSGSSAGETSSASSTAAAECGAVGVVEGDDPRFDHACGEDCDTDWCACDPCAMVFGALGRLSAGAYALRVQGGSSGSGTFAFVVSGEDGTVLAEETRTYEGLFDDSVDFELSEECGRVDVSVQLQSEVCSRIYEVEAVRR